jgi:dihydrofolate reductase
MTKVVADISMSLDGYVTGPDPDLAHGLGNGGEPLHDWAMASTDPVDAKILRDATDATGAVVMGRNLFDIVNGPHGWDEHMGYGAGNVGTPPFFVATHRASPAVRLPLDFTFVTEGVARAVELARGAAGAKDVVVMGGGDVVRQCIDLSLADELHIHLAPIVLGGGTPLFAGSDCHRLEQRSVVVSPAATHLTYAVQR